MIKSVITLQGIGDGWRIWRMWKVSFCWMLLLGENKSSLQNFQPWYCICWIKACTEGAMLNISLFSVIRRYDWKSSQYIPKSLFQLWRSALCNWLDLCQWRRLPSRLPGLCGTFILLNLEVYVFSVSFNIGENTLNVPYVASEILSGHLVTCFCVVAFLGPLVMYCPPYDQLADLKADMFWVFCPQPICL